MASSRDGDCSTTARSVSSSGDDGLSGSDGLSGIDGLVLSAAGNALKLSLLFSVLVSSFSSSSEAGRLSCVLCLRPCRVLGLSCVLCVMGLLLRFLSLYK